MPKNHVVVKKSVEMGKDPHPKTQKPLYTNIYNHRRVPMVYLNKTEQQNKIGLKSNSRWPHHHFCRHLQVYM
jgi:hypothetical protein